MENSYGANADAYGRDYTRGPMSIDDIAYDDLFKVRPKSKGYTATQLKQFEWLKSLGYDYKNMDQVLRTDDPVAGMAAARMVYGRSPDALPDGSDPKALYNYYLKYYNKGGVDKHGGSKEHEQRWNDLYNDLYKFQNGGEQELPMAQTGLGFDWESKYANYNPFKYFDNKLKQEVQVPYAPDKGPNANKNMHTVSSGEYLGSIAKQYGTTVNELMSLNNIEDPNLIKVNQKLNLPEQKNKPQNNSTYKVKSGDSLSKIANANGISVAQLIKLNNISDPNLINVNQELKLPDNIIRKLPEKKEEWVSVDKLQKNKNDINKLTDENIIIKAQLMDKPNQQYVVVDKKTKRLKLYQGDQLVTDFEILTGENAGDAQTVTKSRDLNGDGKITDADKIKGNWETDWNRSNYSTGAGKYTLSNSSPKSEAKYQNAPSFNLLNENGIEVSTAIHGAPKSRLKYYNDNNLENNKASTGCINGKCSDLKTLYSMNLPKGTPVYILPEDDGNHFEMVDGKAVMRMSADNRKKYQTYKNKNGQTEKGQGGNYSVNTLNYKPIKADFNETKFKEDVYNEDGFGNWFTSDTSDQEEYENTTKPFISALEKNKQEIMKAASISGDVYNQLAKMAFGIYGTESNYGDTHSTGGNFGRALGKAYDSKSSSSPDYESKATTYGADEKYKSVSLTQIRWN